MLHWPHSKRVGDTAAVQVSVGALQRTLHAALGSDPCVCLWLSAGGVGWWQPIVHVGVGLALAHICLYVWVDRYIVTMAGFSKFKIFFFVHIGTYIYKEM